jgi:hypothetical protein
MSAREQVRKISQRKSLRILLQRSLLQLPLPSLRGIARLCRQQPLFPRVLSSTMAWWC